MENLFWPLMILLLAIVLLVMEVFIPSGGVLGVLCGLAFLTAIGAAFSYAGMKVGAAFLLGVSILVPMLLYGIVLWWPRTPIGRRILIQPPPEDQLLPEGHRERQQWVGRRGVAVTALLPSGAIRIEGRSIDAISDGMPIEAGTPIEIVAVRGVHLVVRPCAPTAAEPTSGAAPPAVDLVVPDPFDDSLS